MAYASSAGSDKPVYLHHTIKAFAACTCEKLATSINARLTRKLPAHVKELLYACPNSDFIWPFLMPYMGVIPNPKMAFNFQISCILVLIFLFFMIYFSQQM